MNPARYGETNHPGCFSTRPVAVLDPMEKTMNWLSQMFHTQIDLRKQYPAESCRSKSPDGEPDVKNTQSKVTRSAILKALGDDKLTTAQLFKRIPAYRDKHSLGRMLRAMEKSNLVVSEGTYNVLWSRK